MGPYIFSFINKTLKVFLSGTFSVGVPLQLASSWPSLWRSSYRTQSYCHCDGKTFLPPRTHALRFTREFGYWLCAFNFWTVCPWVTFGVWWNYREEIFFGLERFFKDFWRQHLGTVSVVILRVWVGSWAFAEGIPWFPQSFIWLLFPLQRNPHQAFHTRLQGRF